MGNRLYCGDCNNYLMASDGNCHDCSCGWKQPPEPESKPESLTFEEWWEAHGQFVRAGGGDYEMCFAYAAWQYLKGLE